MPEDRHLQTSLAAGEFDPLLWSREDVSFFYNSARLIENAVPLPQGGAKRREGWRFRGVQRGALTQIDLTGATVSAVNGGTAANAIDGTSSTALITTTEILTSLAYEVFRIDLGTDVAVSMVDLRGLGMVNGGEANIAIQYSDDATFWTVAAQLRFGSAIYTRRFANRPNNLLGTARYWRVLVLNETNLGGAFVRFDEFVMHIEQGYSSPGATAGNFSLHRLTASAQSEYAILATAGCGDVYRCSDGQWVAAIAMPYGDGQVANLKTSNNLDTMIFYHQDIRPTLIQRLGSDFDWQCEAVQFDTVVQYPFDDDNVSGGHNEIQFLRFEAMNNADTLAIEFNGEISPLVTWTNDETVNAANLKTAIQALDDFDLVSVTATGAGVNSGFNIEFQGSKAQTPVAVLVVDILTGSGTVELSRIQYGHRPTDALWSATRGHARCGAFYQGRHWMGGFKSRPDLIVASRAGALFDFKQDADPVAGSPIVVAPNVDDQIIVHNLFPGRHLQIFTSTAEMYIPDEPITIDNIAIKTTTSHGCNANAQPVDVQGGTLFSDRNGRALREYLFQDAEQSYSAEPVSLLAGHLMAQPKSISLRRQRDVDEPTLLLIANTGTDRAGQKVPAAMCVIDRAQQVTGFCRIKTQGTPLAFATSQGGDAFAVVQRDLAGPVWNFLEQFDDAYMSDAGVKVTGSGNTIDLTLPASHLNGQTVFVHANGLPLGEFTVTDNVINLGDQSYSGTAEIGLKMVPRIVLHPYKGRGQVSPTMKNMRIHRALLQMERTAAIAIGMNGQRPRPVSLQNHDSGFMDPTLEELLYTGAKRVSGLGRWEKEPALEITQIEPMPFLLRSVTYDVRY